MNTEKINNLFLVLLSIVIAACNNGGTDSSNNVTPSGTVASLMFSQPYELASFENTAGNGYVVISNTDKNKNVTNITLAQ